MATTCAGFSQHPWRKNICNRCFNKQEEHHSLTTTKIDIHSSSNQNTINENSNRIVVADGKRWFYERIDCYDDQRSVESVVEEPNKIGKHASIGNCIRKNTIGEFSEEIDGYVGKKQVDTVVVESRHFCQKIDCYAEQKRVDFVADEGRNFGTQHSARNYSRKSETAGFCDLEDSCLEQKSEESFLCELSKSENQPIFGNCRLRNRKKRFYEHTEGFPGQERVDEFLRKELNAEQKINSELGGNRKVDHQLLANSFVLKKETGQFCKYNNSNDEQKRVDFVVDELRKFASEFIEDSGSSMQNQVKRSKIPSSIPGSTLSSIPGPTVKPNNSSISSSISSSIGSSIPSPSTSRRNNSDNHIAKSNCDVSCRKIQISEKRSENSVQNRSIASKNVIKIDGKISAPNKKSIVQNPSVSNAVKLSGIPRVAAKKPVQCKETIANEVPIHVSSTGIPRVSKKPVQCNKTIPARCNGAITHEENNMSRENSGISTRVSKKPIHCNDETFENRGETIVSNTGIPKGSKKSISCNETLTENDAYKNGETITVLKTGIPRVSKKPVQCEETNAHGKSTANSSTGIARVSKKPVHCSEAMEGSIAGKTIRNGVVTCERFQNPNEAATLQSMKLETGENSTKSERDFDNDRNNVFGETGLTTFGFSKIPKIPQKDSKNQLTTFRGFAKPESETQNFREERRKEDNNFPKDNNFIETQNGKENNEKTDKEKVVKRDFTGENKTTAMENRKPSHLVEEKKEKSKVHGNDIIQINDKSFEAIMNSNSNPSATNSLENAVSKSKGVVRSADGGSLIRVVTGGKEKMPVIRDDGGKKGGINHIPELIQIGGKQLKNETKFSSFKDLENSSESSFGKFQYLDNGNDDYCDKKVPCSMENLSQGDENSGFADKRDWKSVTGSLDRAINRKRCDKIGKIQNGVSLKSVSESKIPQKFTKDVNMTAKPFEEDTIPVRSAKTDFPRIEGQGNDCTTRKIANDTNFVTTSFEHNKISMTGANNEFLGNQEDISGNGLKVLGNEKQGSESRDVKPPDLCYDNNKSGYSITPRSQSLSDKDSVSKKQESHVQVDSTFMDVNPSSQSSTQFADNGPAIIASSISSTVASAKSDLDSAQVSSDSVQVSSGIVQVSSCSLQASSRSLTEDETNANTDCKEHKNIHEHLYPNLEISRENAGTVDQIHQRKHLKDLGLISEDMGAVISAPMTSSFSKVQKAVETDFITIKDKSDSNNNLLEPNNLVKLGSFSANDNSKFGVLSSKEELDMKSTFLRTIEADGYSNKSRIWSNSSPFDIVQVDNKTESTSNRSTHDQGSPLKGNKTRPFGKNKSNKTLPSKLGKGKSKKKSKDVGDQSELRWGSAEMFYSTSESMALVDEDRLGNPEVQLCTENFHYKVIPDTNSINYKLDSPCFNGEENSQSSLKFPEFSKLESGMDLEKSLVVKQQQGPNLVSKPSAKIKPYTVVDLSTMATLSAEEVDNCLDKATKQETIKWLKYGQTSEEDDDDDEAPTDILPPKNFRKRSKTVDVLLNTSNKETVSNMEETSCSKSAMSNEQNVAKMPNYSQPGNGLNENDENMGGFRHRSKTMPVKSELKNKAKIAATNRSTSVSESPEKKQADADNLSPSNNDNTTLTVIKNQGIRKDPCSSSISIKTRDTVVGSQDFPPLPSAEELHTHEIQIERSSTPDWPPAPTSIDDVRTEENKIEAVNGKEAAAIENNVTQTNEDMTASAELETVKLPGNDREKDEGKQEVQVSDSGSECKTPGTSNEEVKSESKIPGTENEEVKSESKIPGTENGKVRVHDAHRSLPPIPVDENNPEVPLSWVTKAAVVGPGPYIPMCHRDSDEIPTAHFYDDIDNIRKIAQERAMMIKRLQDEEEAERGIMGTADVKATRTSLGEMPDVIPNLGELNPGIEEIVESGNRTKDIGKKKKKRKSGKDKKAAKDEANDDIKDLPVVSNEKKNRSRFAKLIRKLSAPVKNSGDYSLVQRKATTPQPVRKSTFAKTPENSRTEILATPSAGRRLFSLSRSRGHRQRTTSDTEIMKSILEKDSAQDTKSRKHRTGTISFGRRKGKTPDLEQKAFSEDNRSIHSLEMMRIGYDFDSQSCSSTRITPATSPLLLTKFNLGKKYKAPDPPNWRQNRTECGSSSRSECSGSEKSFGCVLDPVSVSGQPDETGCGIETTNEGCYDNFPLSKAQVLKPAKPLRESLSNSDKSSSRSESTRNEATIDIQDDVFAENSYDNYPFSKQNLEMPKKPPRSESDSDSTKMMKVKPNKPRRSSKEPDILTNPEPYSSQRIHRQIIGHKLDLDARFSPTLSNSGDETRSEKNQYQIPYDNVPTDDDNSSIHDNVDANFGRRYENLSRSEELLGYNDVVYRRPGSSVSEGNHREHIYDRIAGNSPNVLRYSIDSYDKLLEIHRDTVQQISSATCFKCDCSELEKKDWNDFKIRGKMMNFGVGSYVTVPVSLERSQHGSEVAYSAWLRQSLDFLQNSSELEALDVPLCELSSHENVLHICKDIQRSKTGQNETEAAVPQDIQVKRMLISKQMPKMSLAKYLSSTLDKHEKDPESYEKEACLILLQIFKGLRHILNRGYYIEDFGCDLVLLAENTFGKNNNNKESKGCPTALCLALPGLLKKHAEVTDQSEEVKSQRLGVKGQPTEIKSQSSFEAKGSEAKSHPRSESDLKESLLASSLEFKGQSDEANDMEVKVQGSLDGPYDDQEITESSKKEKFGINSSPVGLLPVQCHKDFIVLIFELFHSSQNFDKNSADSLKDFVTKELPVKSIYSKRMQFVIYKLTNEQAGSVTISDLVKYMELITFCPPLAENVDEQETELLIRKWRNRRCVDIVTDILKKYSLVALANGLASGGNDKMGLTRDCSLECQFLANTSIADIRDIFSIL